MLQISCPWCGPRDETEYHYGGQAHVAYPEDPAALSDEEWAAYLFFRDNPKGPFAERWVHSTGCRRWFNVVRDTRTYEVLAVYTNRDPRPEIGPEIGPEISTDAAGGRR
jgi:heterotetrameric sarcosine oxidase delta subunit